MRVFVVPLSYSHGDDSGAIFSQDAILDSLAETMNSTAGTRYRFTWEDTLAFKHWFERAGEKRKHNIQRLVRAGHFEFVGGGMAPQHGAASTVEEIIHQYSEGHSYLADALRTRPRVAWQVDGSGSAGMMPYILDAMGFSAVVLDVASAGEVKKRQRARELEFVWRPDQNSAGTLAHVLSQGLESPAGLDFEKSGAEVTKETVKQFAEGLAHVVRERVAHVRTRNVMIPFGGENTFQDAGKQFKNMDRLMAYVAAQSNMGMTMRYATMSEYLETVRACAEEAEFWPEHHGGFEPGKWDKLQGGEAIATYAAATPIRRASQNLRRWLRGADLLFLHSLETSSPLKGDPNTHMDLLLHARHELAVSQHFRATAGKFHRAATDSYVRRLDALAMDLREVVAKCSRTLVSANSSIGAAIVDRDSFVGMQALNQGGEMAILATNLLGWQMNTTFSVEVPEDMALGVTDEDGNAKLSQISRTLDGKYQIHFQGQLPGLGLRAFFIRQVLQSAVSLAVPSDARRHEPSGPAASKLELVLEGGRVRAIFSDLTGALMALEDVATGKRIVVHHEVLLHTGGAEMQMGTVDLLQTGKRETTVEQGSIVSEITLKVTKSKAFGDEFGSQLEVRYRVHTSASDDILGTVLSVKVLAQGVPVNSVVVSKVSTTLSTTVTYDQSELGFQPLEQGSKRHPSFLPMASTVLLHGKEQTLAVMTPVTVGIYSPEQNSVQLALYERPPGGDPRDQGATFATEMWLALTHTRSTSHLQLAKMLRHPHVEAYAPAPSRRKWRKGFQGIVQPMLWKQLRQGITEVEGTGLLDPRIHVLTARVRDSALDSAVIRFANTADHPSHGSVKMDLHAFFAGMRMMQWKAESLAISYRNVTEESEPTPEQELWGLNQVTLPSRSVQTLTALFESAQPFDHAPFLDGDLFSSRAETEATDIEGKPKRHGPYKANIPHEKADPSWLHSQSLSGVTGDAL